MMGQPGYSGDLRSRLLLQAAAESGYDAVNVGPLEASRWPNLPGLLGDRKVPWVSANVTFPSGGPILPPMKEFEFPGLKIAVVGLSEPDQPIAGIVFQPSLAALQSALGALSDPAERVVVIGRVPVTRAALIASSHPEILAVLSGYGVMESDAPLMFGSAVAAFPGEQGKNMIDLRLALKGGMATLLSYRLVPLDRSITGLPDWQSKMDETLKTVREAEFDFGASETGEPSAPEH